MTRMASERQAPWLDKVAKSYRAKASEIGYDFEKYPNAAEIKRDMTFDEAHKFLSELIDYAKSWPSFRPCSKEGVVAEISYQLCKKRGYMSIPMDKGAMTRLIYDQILKYAENEYEIQGDFEPLIFTRNPDPKRGEPRGGSRIPLDYDEACEAFRKRIGIVKEEVNKRLRRERDGDNTPPEPEPDEDDIPDIPEPEEEKKSEPPKSDLWIRADDFWERFVAAREYTELHKIQDTKFDTLERRPWEAGVKMIVEGIPVDAIMHAMTMSWGPEQRRELGITDYDVREFHPERRVDGLPPEFPYMDALIRQRIWPWLIADAGVGKTTSVKKIADYYGMPFTAVPLNRGTSPSAFNGRPKITNTSIMVRFLKAMYKNDEEKMTQLAQYAEQEGDVTVSEFTKIFRGGGHILLDELDAADENLLMMINMPLANGMFANTATGETYPIHPDCILWAASNTMGMGVTAGAGKQYRARNALDFATIDRFRMGRIVMRGDINDYRKGFEAMVRAYE